MYSVPHIQSDLCLNRVKAFRSNANHALADSPGYIVNKFKYIQGWKGASLYIVKSQVEQVWTWLEEGGKGKVQVLQVWTWRWAVWWEGLR